MHAGIEKMVRNYIMLTYYEYECPAHDRKFFF